MIRRSELSGREETPTASSRPATASAPRAAVGGGGSFGYLASADDDLRHTLGMELPVSGKRPTVPRGPEVVTEEVAEVLVPPETVARRLAKPASASYARRSAYQGADICFGPGEYLRSALMLLI